MGSHWLDEELVSMWIMWNYDEAYANDTSTISDELKLYINVFLIRIMEEWPKNKNNFRRVILSSILGSTPSALALFRPVAWHGDGRHLHWVEREEAQGPVPICTSGSRTYLSADSEIPKYPTGRFDVAVFQSVLCDQNRWMQCTCRGPDWLSTL